jgi:NAD(P)-dependent dehydrogenase (short-subunit alcohol dehydrogenase family)
MDDRKIAIVTGSNRGIGKEIVDQLVENGFRVISTGRSMSKLKFAFQNAGPKVIPFELDVSSDKSCELFELFLKENFAKIDVLVNNAGIIDKSAISTFDIPKIEKVMNTNFYGSIRISKIAYPFLKKSLDGRIINVSSGMGEIEGMNGSHAAYRLSKLALNGFTIMLANDIENTKVKVNAMCPGWCKTEMGGAEATRTPSKGAETVVWLATEKNIPNGKFFRDKEVISW